MSAAAAFASTPRYSQATLTGAHGAAATFRSGAVATAMVTFFTGGASGSRIDRVLLKHSGTNGAPTVALSVCFFIHDGTNRRLVAEVDTGTIATPAPGTATLQMVIPILEGIILPNSSHLLQAVVDGWVNTDDDFTAAAWGGDF